MQDSEHHTTVTEEIPSPISVSHFVHVLQAYRYVIAFSFGAVLLAYIIGAAAFFLMSPSLRLTTLKFRVEFVGASEGKYPNGTKFSGAEIISTPILLKVFNDNHLRQYTKFPEFTRSIFVLESNEAYEKLVADYQSRLSDPKLTMVDRERFQKEFDMKRESLSKNDFSINFARTENTVRIPAHLVQKVLFDTLADWADFAINEQRVLKYRVAVLSPTVADPSPFGANDPIIALHVLRSKIERVLDNIDQVGHLPAAELVRSRTDKLSLAEVRVRLEETMRFGLEPLIPIARASMTASTGTIRFLETQLAYDQRALEAARGRAEQIRQSIAVYSLTERAMPEPVSTTSASAPTRTAPFEAQQTIMPQLSDSFIDRLVSLTTNSVDTAYRQNAVNDYRSALMKVIPEQEAVAYDRQVLDEMRAPANSRPSSAEFIHEQTERARADVRRLVLNVNEIHEELSRHLTPSTELFSASGTPITRIDRGASLGRLFLIGLLITLASLPLIILGCVLHNRVREEEANQSPPQSHLESA